MASSGPTTTDPMDNLLESLTAISLRDGEKRPSEDTAESAHSQVGTTTAESEQKRSLVKAIRAVIEASDSCVAWMRQLPSVPPLEEQISILKTLSTEFEDFMQRKDERETDLKYSAAETITKRCIQLYIYILKGDLEECPSVVAEALKLIQYCVDEEYVKKEQAVGYKHALLGLETWYLLESKEIGKLELEDLENLLSKLSKVQDFNLQNKVGLTAFKYYFCGNLCRSNYEFQRGVAFELTKLEPDNPEWHSNVYLTYRFERENVKSRGEPPSKQEIDSVLRAVSLSDRIRKDPRILVSYITCMSDAFRHEYEQTGKSSSFRFKFGTKTFNSTQEVMQTLRDIADTILAMDAISVRSNINIARIFTSTMPFVLRDYDFARACIKRALLFHPNSSKANHRMAVWHIQKCNIDSAGKYLKKAFQEDPRNVKALQDLLIWYLRSSRDFHEEAETIFAQALSNSHLKTATVNHGYVTFLEGIFNIQRGNKASEAVACFIKSRQIFAKAPEYFENLQRDLKRFKYDFGEQERLKKNIESLLENAMRTEFDPEKHKILKEMYEGAIGASRSWKSGGSRGGHRGGRGGARGGGAGFGSGRSQGTGNGGYWKENSRKEAPPSSAKTVDHYAVLGLTKTATKAEIKKTYYDLARKHHPDKNAHLPDDQLLEKQELMKKLNDAWTVLTAKA